MSKVAIVYWSGTGNTEMMSKSVEEGAIEAGKEVSVFQVSDFDVSTFNTFDAIAFGCPAKGNEELEDEEFQPKFDECKPLLKGKRIGLFGSYSWAEGEWMDTWKQECIDLGAVLVCDPVICYEEPDSEGEKACKNLGKEL